MTDDDNDKPELLPTLILKKSWHAGETIIVEVELTSAGKTSKEAYEYLVKLFELAKETKIAEQGKETNAITG